MSQKCAQVAIALLGNTTEPSHVPRRVFPWGEPEKVGELPTGAESSAYWPWTQLMRSLSEDQNLSSADLAPLAQILPEASASDGPESELQPDQARFLLLESVRSLLAAVANSTPLLLVLEDLHAADDDSLYLLHYIARHAASLPLLVIGTYREIEARASADTEALWRTSRDAMVLRLSRLGEPEIREYLKMRGDDTPDDQSVRQLLSTTSGNPLFLVELVELLERYEDAAHEPLQLPDSVQQVIRQQLTIMPEPTVAMLASASVFGREFGASQLATLVTENESGVVNTLQPAIEASIIRLLEGGGYRFCHALYRDVLYQDLDASERALAHLNCATQLRAMIDAGDRDSWAALARHLQLAGPENRYDVITALRAAADRANERLAFEDAADLLHRALVAFGEGPSYEPEERCRLLVDYASALLITGQIEAGQRHCRDAFAIARTLGDPTLMSDVALAWGSAIIVAKVDKALIAALEECLSVLPTDDAAMRSRVQARLAGALQPALDPTVPMAMARDAIALARTTDDEQVLYNVLRFALAALMDFAPPTERIELNREYARIAAKLDDVPQQFRSNLLLMIDASETADRLLMNTSIDACGRLAEQISLPHYQWRAASARAMGATIDGDFDKACDLLDAAEAYALQVDDLQAAITLSIQRFALLVEWESPRATPLEEIEARLAAAYEGGLGDAEFFVSPLLAVYKDDVDENAAQAFVANAPFVDRTFAGGDRYSLTVLGQMALKAGELGLAQRCYDALIDFRDGCATLGLMGSCWCGPVAYWLGILAHGLGQAAAARGHFDESLAVAQSMRARPYVARIHASLAKLLRATGADDEASKHERASESLARELGLRPVRLVPASPTRQPAAIPPTQHLLLEQRGDVWSVDYAGQSAIVRDSKGLQMLARLIERPDADIHVLELSGSPGAPIGGDAGPMLDAVARRQYIERAHELKEELDEAEALADIGRADSLRGELDFITRELSRAYGLGGRERSAGDATERARVNVRRRIKDAVGRIGEQLPEAGKYLENTINTVRYCRYTPL